MEHAMAMAASMSDLRANSVMRMPERAAKEKAT